jgi:hypothetical protein
VKRWNVVEPPNTPPLKSAVSVCSPPALGNGRSTRVSCVKSAPSDERKQFVMQVPGARPDRLVHRAERDHVGGVRQAERREERPRHREPRAEARARC